MVGEVNTALAWQADSMTATAGSMTAAATSATAAATSATAAAGSVVSAQAQVGLAAQQAGNAAASANSAQVAAVSAGAAAGLPALSGHGGQALCANMNETGVEFKPLGQAIGDVLITDRVPSASYVLADTIYSRAAYPELFSLVGTLAAYNDGTNFTPVTAPFSNVVSIACGQGDVFIAVGSVESSATGGRAVKSTDGGATWTAVLGLNSKEPLSYIATDSGGNWFVVSDYNYSTAYRSSDNGLTWVSATKPSASFSPVFLVADQRGVFIYGSYWSAGNQAYYFYSTDYGVTWIPGFSVSSGYVPQGAPATDGNGMWLSTLSLSSNSMTVVSYDNFASASYFGDIYSPRSGGGGVIVGAGASLRSLTVVSDGGLSCKYAPNIWPSSYIVDRSGCIHVHSGLVGGATMTKVWRSYDRGETWATFPRSATPIAMGVNTTCVGQSGAWVSVYSGVWYRSTRLYNYDVATQFRTPQIKAPKGFKAYIKARTDIA
jgi:hypothetical protein